LVASTAFVRVSPWGGLRLGTLELKLDGELLPDDSRSFRVPAGPHVLTVSSPEAMDDAVVAFAGSPGKSLVISPDALPSLELAYPRFGGDYFALATSVANRGLAGPGGLILDAGWYHSDGRGVSGSLYYAGAEYRQASSEALLKIGTGHSWRLSHFTLDFSWLAINTGASWAGGGGFVIEYELAAAFNIPLYSWLGLQVRPYANGGFLISGSDTGQLAGGISLGLLIGSNHSDVEVVQHRPASVPLVAVEDPSAETAPLVMPRRVPPPPPEKIALRTVDVALQPAVDAWLAGTAAGQPLGNVFTTGAGGAVTAGVGLMHDCHVYVEYDRTFYGVGGPSPYSALPSHEAWRDFAGVGFRWSGDGAASPVLDAASGYSVLSQAGSDRKGGSASISLPSWEERLGLGLSFRLTDRIRLEPLFHLDLGAVAGYEATTQPAESRAVADRGSVARGGLRVGLEGGLSLSYGIPL
jgi:hypothetical protein